VPDHDDIFLRDLAESLGWAVADNGGAVLVHVIPQPEGPDVGVLPLDGLAPAIGDERAEARAAPADGDRRLHVELKHCVGGGHLRADGTVDLVR